jgi:hypothetical protein
MIMNYKIIGWADLEITSYPVHKNITDDIRKLIVEEIRKHGYLFGGDKHEEYCPVLNDGTLVSYSWRGWGGVMAEAWHVTKGGMYSYMFAYMDELIDPKKRKYPPYGVDVDQLEDKECLAETFEILLDQAQFEELKGMKGKGLNGGKSEESNEGKRKVKLHVSNEIAARMDEGDYIIFTKSEPNSAPNDLIFPQKTSKNGQKSSENEAKNAEKLKFCVSKVEYFEPDHADYLAEQERLKAEAKAQKDSEKVVDNMNATNPNVEKENAKPDKEKSLYDYYADYEAYYQRECAAHYGDITVILQD